MGNLSHSLEFFVMSYCNDILYLDLSSNFLTGPLPLEIGNLKGLVGVDFSMNNFSGYNKLQGSIPESFGDLSNNNTLNLSNNNLSGAIPISLEKLSYLEDLDLSFNKLEGEILRGGSFGNFLVELFEGNKLLYGSPCKTSIHHASWKNALLLRTVLPLRTIFMIVVILLILRCRKRGKRPSNDANISPVATSCSNEEFKALILEYKPHGSLEKYLYSGNCSLDIFQRLNSMIDVALALEYMHFGYSAPVIHCDLKANNVLLDDNMVAHLSDFGIAKTGEDQSMTQTQTLATIGYMAPEYGREGRVSANGDVYSFGIMLMKTFIGKKPTDEIFNEEMTLKHWVNDWLPISIMEVIDANLLSREDIHFVTKEQFMSFVFNLAMECTVESPEQRINPKEIVTRLLKIIESLLKKVGGKCIRQSILN
ncbi:hypothetical protein CUMW_268350 [Citrus unshiu]|uniref:non-specific serine/threonine protein kinase n=1 Tax=Citrus unshiu TaxID=55188 RepID=A0A2H5QWH3_CITUN|nr:hypothetical protein CUMW_268350 [Citrus unshiu]